MAIVQVEHTQVVSRLNATDRIECARVVAERVVAVQVLHPVCLNEKRAAPPPTEFVRVQFKAEIEQTVHPAALLRSATDVAPCFTGQRGEGCDAVIFELLADAPFAGPCGGRFFCGERVRDHNKTDENSYLLRELEIQTPKIRPTVHTSAELFQRRDAPASGWLRRIVGGLRAKDGWAMTIFSRRRNRQVRTMRASRFHSVGDVLLGSRTPLSSQPADKLRQFAGSSRRSFNPRGNAPQNLRKRTKAGARLPRYSSVQMNKHVSLDPFFRSDVTFAEPSAEYCQTCPQATSGGFCGARIQPDCLRIDANGVVRVSLSAPARTWFETLAQLGEVLHLTRNPVAVLARLGQMPLIEDWRNIVLSRDSFGMFAPNLAEYSGLWAVREASPLGMIHGLEARDVSGIVFERVLLPARARRELFEQFVTAYQSPPEEAGSWFPANHAWGASRRATLASRIPWLRLRWTNGDRKVRRLPARFVPKLLIAAARAKLELRVTLFHPALTRTVKWTPQAHAESHGHSSSEFFDGECIGLHLNRQFVASVWLWMGQCSCCADRRWSIEVADARDQLGLALMAGDEGVESEWRALLESCLP